MKRLIALAALLALSPGCILPNYSRIVPENKSAHIRIFSSIYGYIEIDTRVVGDTNALPALPNPTLMTP